MNKADIWLFYSPHQTLKFYRRFHSRVVFFFFLDTREIDGLKEKANTKKHTGRREAHFPTTVSYFPHNTAPKLIAAVVSVP